MTSAVLQLAQEARSAIDFEARVLELLQRAVGFDVAYFSTKGAEAAPTVVGLGQELVARAVRGGPRYQRDLLPVKRVALEGRGVAVDSRVLGEQGVRRTVYYREIAREVGGRHSLMAYVPLRGDVVAGIMLGRCGSAFSDAQLARVEALLVELGVARASFGLPMPTTPLRAAPAPRLLARLVGAARVLDSKPLGWGTVEVRERDGFREMLARENGTELIWTRASVNDPSRSGWPYVELFHVAAQEAMARTRALFLGCGGAVALRQFAQTYRGVAIDLVESEPEVIELARTWFDLDAIPGLTVHVGDGARFVQQAPPGAWDIVVVDAFDASEASGVLLGCPFFRALRRGLREGGALAINVIGTLDGHGPVADVRARLRQLFSRVRVVPVMEADERYSPSALRNVVLVASEARA